MTVLYEYTYDGGADGLISLIAPIGAILLALMFSRWILNEIPMYEKIIISVLSFAISFGMVYGIIKLPQVMSTTRYKVKMEDEINMSDFLKNYKIIDTEGDIVVIEQIDHGE